MTAEERTDEGRHSIGGDGDGVGVGVGRSVQWLTR